MINFEKLTKSRSSPALTKLVDLFEQLDRKATHQILRPVQEEALQLLDAQHADLRAMVGGGYGNLGEPVSAITRLMHRTTERTVRSVC